MKRTMRLLILLGALLALAACTTPERSGPFGKSDQEAAQINAQLGASYMQAGNLQQANEKLQRALEQDSSNSDVHAMYALLQMRLDKPDEAEHHFERALALDPDNLRVKNNYATLLCERGDYDTAIDLFLEVAEDRLYERPAAAYANAGTCARDAGRDDDARTYLRRALDTDSSFRRPLLELAEISYDNRRADQAADYLDRYHDAVRPSARSLWLGVRIERMRGDRDAAERYGRSLVPNFPDSDQADEFLETRTQ